MSIEEFQDFNNLLFPLDYNDNVNISFDQINQLMHWYSHINVNTTLEVLVFFFPDFLFIIPILS